VPHRQGCCLEDLATNFSGATFDKISDPTPVQRRAFDLIGTPIPLTLTVK